MADGYSIVSALTVGSVNVGKFIPYGAVAHVSALFYNSTGSLADPSVVKFSYTAAALGVTTTLTYGSDAALVKAGTGSYFVDVSTSESGGQFDWRFFATGTGQSAVQDRFYVRPATT